MIFQSKIEINPETGTKCLIVYYDSAKNNFDEAINQAIAFHNIDKQQDRSAYGEWAFPGLYPAAQSNRIDN